MPSARVTKVVVFDERLYHGNGDVFKWCALITTHFTNHARRYAPVRSGELMEGISGDTKQVGIRQVQGTITSTAPHTMYVLRGTQTPIRTTRGHANPEGGFVTLWGSINPQTGRFTTRYIRGQRRFQKRIPVSGYWLNVREGGGYPRKLLLWVHGQEANNFLARAWRATARNHRAIRHRVPVFLLER